MHSVSRIIRLGFERCSLFRRQIPAFARWQLLLLHLAFYLNYSGYPAEQGRYLLPLAPLFGAAIAASTLALGRRRAPLLATFYVTALG